MSEDRTMILSLKFNETQVRKFERIAQLVGQTDVEQLVRWSLATYESLVEIERIKGGELLFRPDKGYTGERCSECKRVAAETERPIEIVPHPPNPGARRAVFTN